MRAKSVVVIGLLATACAAIGDPSTTVPASSPSSPSTVASTIPPVIDCPGAGDFEEGGGILAVDGAGSDAGRLGRISWQTSDQCETFVFEFETAEGAPATTVPAMRLDHLESFQVLRVSIGVGESVLTDQLVETPLVGRLYAVNALDTGMFVDLHLKGPAAARARVESSPARLVLDLRPGFVELAGASVISDSVVLVSPSVRTGLPPDTTVSGYAMTSDGAVEVVATQGGQVILDVTSPVAGEPPGWGEFRVDLSLPDGDSSVFIGQEGPDGLDGLAVDLTVG